MQINTFCLQQSFFLVISTDDGTFVLILLFIGFKVDTDVGINASSVPVWISSLPFVLRVLKVQIWGSSDHLFFSRFSTEDSSTPQIDSSVVFPWVHCRD